MAECNRCGKCCYYPNGEKTPKGEDVLKACKFLVTLQDGTTLCRTFKDRLGKEIDVINGRSIRCIFYNALSEEILGCPLNNGKKPLVDVVVLSPKRAIGAYVDGRPLIPGEQPSQQSQPL